MYEQHSVVDNAQARFWRVFPGVAHCVAHGYHRECVVVGGSGVSVVVADDACANHCHHGVCGTHATIVVSAVLPDAAAHSVAWYRFSDRIDYQCVDADGLLSVCVWRLSDVVR